MFGSDPIQDKIGWVTSTEQSPAIDAGIWYVEALCATPELPASVTSAPNARTFSGAGERRRRPLPNRCGSQFGTVWQSADAVWSLAAIPRKREKVHFMG